MAGRNNRFTWMRLGALSALALALSCSFLVDFDPNEKPCGADGTCLEGYSCSLTRLCVRVDAGTPDAGDDADAGEDLEAPDASAEDAGEEVVPDVPDEIA